jgi:hypothetical protein
MLQQAVDNTVLGVFWISYRLALVMLKRRKKPAEAAG